MSPGWPDINVETTADPKTRKFSFGVANPPEYRDRQLPGSPVREALVEIGVSSVVAGYDFLLLSVETEADWATVEPKAVDELRFLFTPVLACEADRGNAPATSDNERETSVPDTTQSSDRDTRDARLSKAD